MKQLSTILRNVGSNWVRLVIRIVISLFLIPFIIHKLGDFNYGIWVLIGSIIGYYGLLDLGIGSTVTRYVSKYSAAKDSQNLNEIMSSCFFIFLGVGILCLTLSFVFAFIMPDIFNVPQASKADFSLLILILGLGIAIAFPSKVFGTSISAVERFDVCNNIGITLLIARAILIVYFLSKGYGLIALGVITLGQAIISALLYVRYAFKYLPGLKIRFSLVRKNQLKVIFNYSVFAFLATASYYLIAYTDSLVIGYFLPVAAITYYAIGFKLIEYFKQFIIAVFTTTTPVFSKYEAINEQEKIQILLLKGTKYLALVSMFIGSMLILYGKPFIKLWVGEQYASSYYVLLILVVPSIMNFSQGLSISVFYGLGKHKIIAYVCIVEGIVNLILSVNLVKKYGIYGVAIGTAIPMFISYSVVYPVFICKVVKLRIWEYFYKAFVLPAIISAIFISVMGYILTFVHIESYLQLILMGVLSLLLFAIPAIFFCVEKDEKKMLMQTIPLINSDALET